MSKFNVFVILYSVVMLVLFFTFGFLMTKINPPAMKRDPDILRSYGSDDYIYSNEVLTKDNVTFGLEKVYDDPTDVSTKNVIERHKNRSTIYIDKNFKTNCTSKKILTMTTMKHIKGLRRSVDEEIQQDAIPRSVHLKIKDLDGQPRIEIKVMPEKSKSKKIRKYRSSTNITNNTLKLYIGNDKTKHVHNEISEEVILVIGNNEKLVIDFAKDSINLYDDTLDSVNDIINTNKDDTTLLNDNITETNDNIYNHGLFKTSIGTNTSVVVMNRTESNNTNIENTTQSMSEGWTNEINSIATSFNSVTVVEAKTEMELIQNSTKDSNTTTSYEHSDDRQTAESSPVDSVPVNTLVGLLIPEATATLPFNYHFIN